MFIIHEVEHAIILAGLRFLAQTMEASGTLPEAIQAIADNSGMYDRFSAQDIHDLGDQIAEGQLCYREHPGIRNERSNLPMNIGYAYRDVLNRITRIERTWLSVAGRLHPDVVYEDVDWVFPESFFDWHDPVDVRNRADKVCIHSTCADGLKRVYTLRELAEMQWLECGYWRPVVNTVYGPSKSLERIRFLDVNGKTV